VLLHELLQPHAGCLRLFTSHAQVFFLSSRVIEGCYQTVPLYLIKDRTVLAFRGDDIGIVTERRIKRSRREVAGRWSHSTAGVDQRQAGPLGIPT
jgi:hypothetical protein